MNYLNLTSDKNNIVPLSKLNDSIASIKPLSPNNNKLSSNISGLSQIYSKQSIK